jgi:hypothetical protein
MADKAPDNLAAILVADENVERLRIDRPNFFRLNAASPAVTTVSA